MENDEEYNAMAKEYFAQKEQAGHPRKATVHTRVSFENQDLTGRRGANYEHSAQRPRSSTIIQRSDDMNKDLIQV